MYVYITNTCNAVVLFSLTPLVPQHGCTVYVYTRVVRCQTTFRVIYFLFCFVKEMKLFSLFFSSLECIYWLGRRQRSGGRKMIAVREREIEISRDRKKLVIRQRTIPAQMCSLLSHILHRNVKCFTCSCCCCCWKRRFSSLSMLLLML